MQGAAAAFAWEFGRRHRWGFAALAAYLAMLAAVRLGEIATGTSLHPEWGAGFAFAVLVPVTTAYYWCLVVFSHGHTGNFAGRPSLYPPRLFTLPVSGATLTRWPMLCGAGVVALLWAAVRWLAPWPTGLGFGVPILWPGLLGITLLAWTQAFVWLSYPLAGLRVVSVLVALGAVEIASVVALQAHAGEAVMVALLAPQLPLAYLLARHAVVRARRGDVAGREARASARAQARPAAGSPFADAGRAQRWLEWNRFGRSLPVFVAILLPVELLLLWVSRDAPALIAEILAGAALTPPFMASFTAVAARRSRESGDHGLGPFTAARPLSSSALVGARLVVAAWSTAAAWTLVLAAVPAALALSGTWDMVAHGVRRLADAVGADRVVVAALLVLAMLVLSTWRQMVQSLYLGLTGRPRLIRGSALAMLGLLVAIGPALDWAVTSGARAWFWVALYVALGSIVAARAVLACRIAVRIQREHLLTDRALAGWAAAWLAAVAAVYGVLLWLFATPYMPRFLLLLLATVMVPLVRLSAAPLALAWNRHR